MIRNLMYLQKGYIFLGSCNDQGGVHACILNTQNTAGSPEQHPICPLSLGVAVPVRPSLAGKVKELFLSDQDQPNARQANPVPPDQQFANQVLQVEVHEGPLHPRLDHRIDAKNRRFLREDAEYLAKMF